MSSVPEVTLFIFPRPPNPKHGPALSVFVLKLETWFRMNKIAYTAQVTRPQKAPKNKLPYIKLGNEEHSDSAFIIEMMTRRFNLSIDEGLSDEQLAKAHCIRRTVEEATYWTAVYYRFQERPNKVTVIAAGRPATGLFGLIFGQIAKRVRKALWAQGYGRHTPEEVHKLAADDLRALSVLLGSKSYFLGENPTSVDATVFGYLAQARWVMPDSPEESLVRDELKNLDDFCWRMRNEYWRDWEELVPAKK